MDDRNITLPARCSPGRHSEPGSARRTGTTAAARRGLVIRTATLLACLASASACVFTLHHPTPPPPTAPTSPPIATVEIDATQPWTDSGVIVRAGERLVFWATGEIRGGRPDQTAGPDGVGWSSFGVGTGGLLGRIGNHKPFDVGARTHLFPDMHARPPHIPFSPPPLKIKHDGSLLLGFKNWKPGLYRGRFSVKIWLHQ